MASTSTTRAPGAALTGQAVGSLPVKRVLAPPRNSMSDTPAPSDPGREARLVGGGDDTQVIDDQTR